MGTLLTPQPRVRRIRVLSLLSAATFLFFNSYGSINVAIPMIQAEFGSSLSAVQWIATMGLVLSSSAALCLGRMGDIVGRSRLYKLGVTLYAAGSALAAVSRNFPELLSCRVFMTVGLAMAMPMTTAITVADSRPGRTGASLGILLSAASVGRMTGPGLGGFLIYLAGWRAMFLGNAVIGLGVSIAGWFMLRDREYVSGESFDYLGATALILGHPVLLIGLSLLGSGSGNSPFIVPCFFLGAVGLAGFVLREVWAQRPIIPRPLATDPSFMRAFLILVLFSAGYFPIFILAPLFLHNVLRLEPLYLGLILSALPVMAAFCSPISGVLVDRLDPRIVGAVGHLVIGVGVFVYATLQDESSAAMVLLALALVGIGVGISLPASQKRMFSLISREHFGVTGGMLSAGGPGAGAVAIGLVIFLIDGAAAGPAGIVEGPGRAVLMLLPFPLLAAGFSFLGYVKSGRVAMGIGG